MIYSDHVCSQNFSVLCIILATFNETAVDVSPLTEILLLYILIFLRPVYLFLTLQIVLNLFILVANGKVLDSVYETS